MFVHLTPEKNIRSIQRSGLKPNVWNAELDRGVFAMPVTPNFYISHQWLRELKAYGRKNFCGVYFRIPDDEYVIMGHYYSEHQPFKASEAVGIIQHQVDSEGYEVIIPRKIESKAIHTIRHLPQVLGWRYDPGIRQRPFCGCPACVRPSTVRSKVKNQNWEKSFEV